MTDTNPTAAIEVLARLLCAADVHVHGDDHPTWRHLSTTTGRPVQDDYRKAAAWLLPKMTVATKLPAPADRAAILREAADAAAEKHRRNPWTTAADVIADVRRMADEAQQPETLPPPEGPEYTLCACGHIEPEHSPAFFRRCLECGCLRYRPVAAAHLEEHHDH